MFYNFYAFYNRLNIFFFMEYWHSNGSTVTMHFGEICIVMIREQNLQVKTAIETPFPFRLVKPVVTLLQFFASRFFLEEIACNNKCNAPL